MQGALAGLLGCICGVIGIFAFGFVFVPLAAVCALVGFVRGISGRSAAGIGTSILAGALSVFGFATSPSLWLITAGIFAASQFPSASRPAPQRQMTYAAPPQPAQRIVPLPPAQDPSPPPQPSSMPRSFAPISGTPEAIQQAGAQAKYALDECRNMRLSGQLKTYAASAQCSNPRIIEAYRKAGYRYMDLIVAYTAKRTEISEAVDQGRLTEAQGASQIAQFYTWMVDRERQRDSGGR